MSTKDRLADALMAVGLMDMSLRARGGYYDDFQSPLTFPETQLVEDLAAAATRNPQNSKAINDLRSRVINGEFDASEEESEAWAASPEGQETLTKLSDGNHRKAEVAKSATPERLGDAPIEEKYVDQMRGLAAFLDQQFNGETKGDARKVGFVMMLFEFGDDPGRCNYISNGVARKDIVVLMREMIARFEGQPEPKPGHA